MNIERLKAQLGIDEARRHTAYPDPLTKAEPWTVGVGHTGPEVHKGLVWNDEQIDAALDSDIQKAIDGLDRVIPWWRGLDAVRQNVLLNMCFNMGANGLSKFRNTLKAVATGNYAAASDGMLASLWARQVGARAKRLADQMKTGVF